MHHRVIRSILGGLAIAVASVAGASERATPREARAFFDQAVKYVEANGTDKAWAAFNNRKGPFVRKDLYVYVIDRQGTYVANGAAPDTLVGLKVLDSVDAAGNPLFRQMIAVTTGWGGAVPLWGGDVAKRVNFLEQGGSVWVFKLHKS